MFLLAILSIFQVGCYEDKGNYDYTTVDEVTIEGEYELVYRLKMVGTFVLTDDYYIGFIHPTEREIEPRLGEKVKGRVIGVSPHGMLNLSLKPRAHEALEDDAKMILALLEKSPTGSIPYYDKSDPDAIRSYFGISKAQFKRAVGRLMKEKLVIQEDGQTKLVK